MKLSRPPVRASKPNTRRLKNLPQICQDLSPGPPRRMRNYGIVANELMETQVAERVVVWTAGGDTIQSSYATNCVGVLGSEAVPGNDPLISPRLARRGQGALRRRRNAPEPFLGLTH